MANGRCNINYSYIQKKKLILPKLILHQDFYRLNTSFKIILMMGREKEIDPFRCYRTISTA